MSIINTDKYMFIPFVDKGRDFSGCDCRGLVGLIVKEVFNIDIPDMQVSWEDHAEVNKAIREKNTWRRVIHPIIENPCIVLMCVEKPNQIDHMGLYVGGGDFIHISKRMKRPSINSIHHIYWKYCIEGFYVS